MITLHAVLGRNYDTLHVGTALVQYGMFNDEYNYESMNIIIYYHQGIFAVQSCFLANSI